MRQHAARVGILVARHVAHLHRVVAAWLLSALDYQIRSAHRIVRIVDLEAVERRVGVEVEAKRETVPLVRPRLQVRHASKVLHLGRTHRAEAVRGRHLVEFQRPDKLQPI